MDTQLEDGWEEVFMEMEALFEEMGIWAAIKKKCKGGNEDVAE